MKKAFSLLDRVYRWLCAMGGAAHVIWLFNKFDFFPTEQNLLISLWYAHGYFRWDLPGSTVYDFLDRRVQLLEANIGNPHRRLGARRLEGRFLKALQNERIRLIVVDFLESKEPEEKYLTVMEAIRGAWRMEGQETEKIIHGFEISGSKIGDNFDEVTAPGGKLKGSTADREDGQVARKGELAVREGGRPLNARTYVIAVQLCFELEEKEAEFEVLARQLPELMNFIRERFGVEKLPGRLEDFKGYSYKRGLNERSIAKRGQLRTPFRQIREHPEIFGDTVAAFAGEILRQHFK